MSRLAYSEIERRMASVGGWAAGRRILDDLHVSDPRQRFPDITRARERMGWEPRVPYDAGLVTTVEWFRKQGV